jgi:hypothetical protein
MAKTEEILSDYQEASKCGETLIRGGKQPAYLVLVESGDGEFLIRTKGFEGRFMGALMKYAEVLRKQGSL